MSIECAECGTVIAIYTGSQPRRLQAPSVPHKFAGPCR